MANLQFAFINLHFPFCILQFAFLFIAPSVHAAAPLAVPVSGEPFRADLSTVDANWQLTFRVGQQQQTMPAADLVCWGQCAEQGRAGAIVLTDGSLLTAEVVTADRQQLTADSELFGTLKLPVESLSGIIFHQSSSPADRDKLLDRITRAAGAAVSPLPQAGEGSGVRAGQSDRLLLDNGDELSGQLVAVANGAVKFQTDVGPVDVKIPGATALVYGPARKRTPASQTDRLQTWVGFNDGSRLLVTQLLVENNAAKLTVAGQPLAASQEHIVFLQPLGGRSVYLSDLKPTEYRQTPYLDLSWPFRADRSVTGRFLRCGGRLYLKGLGVHSAARLVYELGEGQGRAAGHFTQFAAELGIDDSTAGGGSVQFRVLVDGQERFASPIIRGGTPPTPVSVDIAGAKKLELLVDYADRADVLDHADWLNARLTR
jgi:hypothetical protein